jgi:hypothetical protein
MGAMLVLVLKVPILFQMLGIVRMLFLTGETKLEQVVSGARWQERKLTTQGPR